MLIAMIDAELAAAVLVTVASTRITLNSLGKLLEPDHGQSACYQWCCRWADQNARPTHAPVPTARGCKGAPRRAGIGEVRFHELRHSFESNLAVALIDVATVSRLVGDSSPQVTLAIYSHVIPKQCHGASELLASRTRDKRGNRVDAAGPSLAVSPGPGGPKSLGLLEASAGIEPAYTDLQSAA
jgi:hypothetical protein